MKDDLHNIGGKIKEVAAAIKSGDQDRVIATRLRQSIAEQPPEGRFTAALHIKRTLYDANAPRNAEELWQAIKVLHGIEVPTTAADKRFDPPFAWAYAIWKDAYSKILAVAPRGGWKGFPLDTPIPTLHGWMIMEQIEVGDQVFDKDGNICNVTGVSEVFIDKECYEFTFSDGTKIVSTFDHLWITEDRKYRDRVAGERRRFTKRKAAGQTTLDTYKDWKNPVPKTTLEIVNSLKASGNPRKNEWNHRITNCGPLQHTHKDLQIDPYILGLWLGDGSTNGYTITTADQEILDAVQELYDIEYRGQYDYRVYGLREQLAGLNLIDNKHVPFSYLAASIEQRLALVQGLMDSDGCATEEGKCTFSNTKLRLVKGLQQLLWSLGMKATITEHRATLNGVDHGPYWILCTSPNMPIFRLTRKAIRVNFDKTYKWQGGHRYIVAARKVKTVPTKCIAVDSPSHTFVAGKQCLVTHNTNGAAILTNLKCRFRSRYTCTHGAALKAQSAVIQRYLEEFSEDEVFKPYFKGKPSKLNARWINNSRFNIVTGSKNGISGQHSNMLTVDELEFWPEDAIEQSWGVPVERNGYPAMWLGFSTRQLASSQMTILTEKAKNPSNGIKLYEWSVFETMERCHKGGIPTCHAIEAHPRYRGVKTDDLRREVCFLWDDCKGALGVRSSGWMKRDWLIEQKRTLTEDSWQTQYLCRRPSTHGLVLHNFDATEATDSNINAGNTFRWEYDSDLPYYIFHDPAESKVAVLAFVQVFEGRIFVFGECIIDNCPNNSVAKQECYDYRIKHGLYAPPEAVIVDPRRPDALADWRNGSLMSTGENYSYNAVRPKIAGSLKGNDEGIGLIEVGIELVRQLVKNGAGTRRIYVNDEAAPRISHACTHHRYKITKSGELVTDSKPEKALKDEIDTIRYGVIYMVQQGIIDVRHDERTFTSL